MALVKAAVERCESLIAIGLSPISLTPLQGAGRTPSSGHHFLGGRPSY